MSRLTLSDHAWQALYAILQTCNGIYVGKEARCRRFVNAVLWIARSGAQWRLLPTEFGKWNSIYKRFAHWSAKGIWHHLFTQCIDLPDREWLVLDSTIVRAHPCAAGAPKKRGGQAAQALGRSGGGFSTKVHTLTEALGQPLRVVLTGGQVHDVTQAQTLLDGQEAEFVIGDRGFASADLAAWLEERGMIPVIPPHPRSHTRPWYDRALYQERHVIECFFNKLKHYRHLFTRFDKLALHYLSFVYFVSALIWLR